MLTSICFLLTRLDEAIGMFEFCPLPTEKRSLLTSKLPIPSHSSSASTGITVLLTCFDFELIALRSTVIYYSGVEELPKRMVTYIFLAVKIT
jgi:hypothetical protein